ncbi:synaptic vesicular amine transporter-like [Mugil cephalus]|uniref:synaptic vesicular amine transporter-like n=1 Tax=Mugil cephalus TaxID=48193 RepID=UPI001FB5BDB7|nr:synaptic vesicular amine transporter-like [Mugil cephalus]
MGILNWLKQDVQVKKMVVAVVFIALFLDHMLLSVVVPILPSFLYGSDQPSTTLENSTGLAVQSPHTQLVNNTSAVLGSTSATPYHNSTLRGVPFIQIPPTTNCTQADSRVDAVSIKLGLLFASKSTIQLIFNPFVGSLSDRIGYHILMSVGFCVIILATTVFAFSSSYILLLLARSLQGIGGSCLSVAGMSMLADMYKDETERGCVMGISFTGLALGLIVGAPFGSVMYQFAGKTAPFLVVAVIAVLGGGLHFIIFQPQRLQIKREKGTPLLTLLMDPYILIAAGAICLTTLIIGIIETTLPIWMMKTMCASKWQQGVVFLPDSVCYLIASIIFGRLSQKYSVSWLCAFFGMILAGGTTISFGYSTNIYPILAQNALIGISVGMVDSSVMPFMGYLVDQRYEPVYGNVYAIADIAVCIGFSVGPAIAGLIMASIGFPLLMAIIGMVNIFFAPLCILLFRPPQREKSLLISKGN